MRWRPTTLLARAIRYRTIGKLHDEKRLLERCLAWGKGRRGSNAEVSAVRTAHFYLALTNCQLGNYAVADQHLSQLGLATRLSDGIWAENCSMPLSGDFFVRVIDDGLPQNLLLQLRNGLSPSSSYWKAHCYDDEDLEFYSHAHEVGTEVHLVDQLIGALRPLLAQVAPNVASSTRLAEWWPHHRRWDQWHGHPLHFDTHEQLLRETGGKVAYHPAISTVVYLCDDSPRFGPTLVTNQTIQGCRNREVATLVRPRFGRVLFFDGCYLHGALPGQPWLAQRSMKDRRLNVMVGWWTRDLKPLHVTDPPRPIMKVGPRQGWVKSLAPIDNLGSVGCARQVDVKVTEPIWTDVVTDFCGEPFAGRFFLSHRDQVKDDLCE